MMKQRCYNLNYPRFRDYGGRGIQVQESWKNDPRAFINYISNLPHAEELGYSLDRIDNDKGYEEGNLKWSTYSEQNLNRRTQKNNTSGVKGVCWHKPSKKWVAQYKKEHLGYFTEFDDAVKARKEAEDN